MTSSKINICSCNIIITNDDKDRLDTILNNAEKKKHSQTKFGGGLVFCEVKFLNVNSTVYSRVVIGVGKDKSVIADLTGMKNYIVTNQSDVQWLKSFTERIKVQSK